MSGSKPALFYVVREFRGQRLFLASVHAGNGSRFVADKKSATRFARDVAMAISKKVSRDVGTVCIVVGGDGEMLEPAAECFTLRIHRAFSGSHECIVFVGTDAQIVERMAIEKGRGANGAYTVRFEVTS